MKQSGEIQGIQVDAADWVRAYADLGGSEVAKQAEKAAVVTNESRFASAFVADRGHHARCRANDGRSVIAKRPDARHIMIGRARQRRPAQEQNER
jgi:hypothetical protein